MCLFMENHSFDWKESVFSFIWTPWGRQAGNLNSDKTQLNSLTHVWKTSYLLPKDTSASDVKEKAGAKVPVHPRIS